MAKACRTKKILIHHQDLKKLLFGDQHWGTQQFFIDKYGQYHTIPLDKFPHYIFLRDNLKEPYTDHIYAQYLKSSWDYKFGNKITKDDRIRKIKEFISFYRFLERLKIAENKKIIEEPISVTVRPDGKFIILDGNHRASIALKLGLDIMADCIHPKDYLEKMASVALSYEFRGLAGFKTSNQDFLKEELELITGRRADILKRFEMIKKEDVLRRSILDLDCNLGANVFVAAKLGAQTVIGVDSYHRLITAAIQLNSYFALPCKFIMHDLNTELPVGPVDTAFCFSIDKHKNKTQLVETILKKTKKTLYFEGSEETNQEDYRYLLNSNYFSSIELLGYLQQAMDSSKLNRPFFRCELRH